MVQAAQRKEAKYSKLVATMRKTGYCTSFVILEIGSEDSWIHLGFTDSSQNQALAVTAQDNS